MLKYVVAINKMRSLEARSFNNWPIIKLSIKTKIMAVVPNNVVRITVIKTNME